MKNPTWDGYWNGETLLKLCEGPQSQPKEEVGKGICLRGLGSPYHLPRDSVTMDLPDDESEMLESKWGWQEIWIINPSAEPKTKSAKKILLGVIIIAF